MKITVILAVEPGDPTIPAHLDSSLENPRRWFWILDDADGTSEDLFSRFVDHVLNRLEATTHQVDDHRICLWDNLRSHLGPTVYNTVYGRATPNTFSFIARPPYQPKYGPTEYMFAELTNRLQQRVQAEWTNDNLP